MNESESTIRLDYDKTHNLLLERIRTGMSFWLGSCVLYFSFLSNISVSSQLDLAKLYLLIYMVPCVLYSINWSMYEMAKLQVYLDVVLARLVGFKHRRRAPIGSKLNQIDSNQRAIIPVIFSMPSVPIYIFAMYLILHGRDLEKVGFTEALLLLCSMCITTHAIIRLYYSFSKYYWKLLAREFKSIHFPETQNETGSIAMIQLPSEK